MKSRAGRLKKIFELAKAEERRACEEMGRVQKSLDAEVLRLGELESYRSNYAQQFESRESVSSARWQDYQNFLTRIDKAVDGQKEIILNGQQTRDVHRRRWLVERQKLESLERVVGRYQKSEDLQADRRTQKTLDDLAATGRFSKARTLD